MYSIKEIAEYTNKFNVFNHSENYNCEGCDTYILQVGDKDEPEGCELRVQATSLRQATSLLLLQYNNFKYYMEVEDTEGDIEECNYELVTSLEQISKKGYNVVVSLFTGEETEILIDIPAAEFEF